MTDEDELAFTRSDKIDAVLIIGLFVAVIIVHALYGGVILVKWK